jgi:hypothetical protein
MCYHQYECIISRVLSVKKSSKSIVYLRPSTAQWRRKMNAHFSTNSEDGGSSFFSSETMVNIYHIIQRRIPFTDVTASRSKGLSIAVHQLINTAPKPFAELKGTSK